MTFKMFINIRIHQNAQLSIILETYRYINLTIINDRQRVVGAKMVTRQILIKFYVVSVLCVIAAPIAKKY